MIRGLWYFLWYLNIMNVELLEHNVICFAFFTTVCDFVSACKCLVNDRSTASLVHLLSIFIYFRDQFIPFIFDYIFFYVVVINCLLCLLWRFKGLTRVKCVKFLADNREKGGIKLSSILLLIVGKDIISLCYYFFDTCGFQWIWIIRVIHQTNKMEKLLA